MRCLRLLLLCLMIFTNGQQSLFAKSDSVADYNEWSKNVIELYNNLITVKHRAEEMGISTEELNEWQVWLEQKVLPQLGIGNNLVVAVVGGTNIGKSTIYNHIVGEYASAVATTGAGTKHAVLLVPSHLKNKELISKLFDGFIVQKLKNANSALADLHGEPHLLWRVGKNVPSQILVMDAPDMDSILTSNWDLADYVGKSADVLVAVITQQKHVDKDVVEYFKKLKKAKKPFIIVINQVDLEYEKKQWYKWLDKFLDATAEKDENGKVQRIDPYMVYVAPKIRVEEGSKKQDLLFYKVGKNGRAHLKDKSLLTQPVSLRDELSGLNISSVLRQTRLGAIDQALSSGGGATALMAKVEEISGTYNKWRQEVFDGEKDLVEWPSPPSPVIIDSIRTWWNERHRAIWKKGIYNTLAGIRWLVHKGVGAPSATTIQTDLEKFEEQELKAILLIIQKVITRLHEIEPKTSGRVKELLHQTLSETSVTELTNNLEKAYKDLPSLKDSLKNVIESELSRLEKDHPNWITMFEYLDAAAAIARPGLSIYLGALSVLGVSATPAYQIAEQAVTETGASLAIGGSTGAASETLLDSVVSPALANTINAFFYNIAKAHTSERLTWAFKWLKKNHFAELIKELDKGANLYKSKEFKTAKRCADWLADQSGE